VVLRAVERGRLGLGQRKTLGRSVALKVIFRKRACLGRALQVAEG
jgi:hypothetical protein